MIQPKRWLAVLVAVCSSLAFSQETQEGRLMRFPDIYKDKVVFSYAGDLWLASTSGGVASRITSHAGRELFPKFSPDGKWIAFTGQYDGNFNVYVMPSTGGLAQSITLYDLKNNTSEDVPHAEYTDTFPMWHGNKVYFSSDRDGEHHFNLYSYDLGSKQVEQVTHFTDWDVICPSLGPNAIVFENGGYLYSYDFQSSEPKKLTIYLPADRAQVMKHWDNVSKLVTDFDIATDGKRAVFAARGDVFTVPAKEGSIRNLTRTPGIREQKVSWSPDGRWIAYISDRTGEDEIYIVPQDGLGKEQQITSGYKGFKFVPAWSPDSKKIAWADKDLNLWWTDIQEKKQVKVDHALYGEITNYCWSPDSKWLSYDKNGENTFAVVYLYSLADNKSTAATSSM